MVLLFFYLLPLFLTACVCVCVCVCPLWKRLKKKSQSVDIISQGFSALIPGLQLNRATPPVAKTTTLEVQDNNATNSQRFVPRCAELKRGYTIGTQACLMFPFCVCACVCVCVWVCMGVCVSVSEIDAQ